MWLGVSLRRNSWEFEHAIMRNSMGNEIWSIYNDKYFEIWTFYTLNQNNLFTSFVSVVVSGVLCRFKLALPTFFKSFFKSLNDSLWVSFKSLIYLKKRISHCYQKSPTHDGVWSYHIYVNASCSIISFFCFYNNSMTTASPYSRRQISEKWRFL